MLESLADSWQQTRNNLKSSHYKSVFTEFLTDQKRAEMVSQGSTPVLFLSYKSLEILFVASVTVNFCVLWSVFLPKLCRAILRGFCHSRRKDDLDEEYSSKLPFFCRRL